MKCVVRRQHQHHQTALKKLVRAAALQLKVMESSVESYHVCIFLYTFFEGSTSFHIRMPWSMTSRMCWGVPLSCRSQKVYRHQELSCIYVEWNNTTHWMRKIQELMEGQACQNYVKNAFRCVYLTIKKSKFSRYLQVLVVTFLPPIMRMNTICKLANSP